MIILPSGKIHVDDERIKRVFASHIQKHFRFDIRDRITIKTDVNQFSLEDKGVWEQAREKKPHYHEVYWDDVWICDYSDSDPVEPTIAKFLFGFSKAYESKQISLNTPKDLADNEAQRIINEAIAERDRQNTKHLESAETEVERMPEDTPEDKLSKQILKELIEDKKQFKQKKGKKNEK